MGFASIDAVVAALTTGSQWKAWWQKLTINAAASAANRWHELFAATGIPTALGAFGGGAGAIAVTSDATAGAPPHGGNVTPATKHLANVLAVTPTATVVPGFAMLVDLLAVYPTLSVNVATGLTNGSAITRYTTGAGNYAFAACQVLQGATQPNISIVYRDADDGGDHTSGQLVFPAASSPVSTLAGNTTVSTGPFFSLASGTNGVRNIQSYVINSGATATGSMWLGICHPLLTIPLLAANTAVERDCLFQLPSMPHVYDGACLGWLLLAGGAMITGANLMFTADVVWGS